MSARVFRTMVPIAALAVTGVVQYRVRCWCGGGSTERALGIFRTWCQATCRRLGIAVAVRGGASAERCVYVANHRSYLDIPVLGGVLGEAFLSRADLARWPVVGNAARAMGTVFIERGHAFRRAQAARALARRLRAGSVVVFPEGTTGIERLPRPFSLGLFRLLERLRVPVVPVTIRYSDRRFYWAGASPLTDHLGTLLSRATTRSAAVHIGSALRATDFCDSEALAAVCHAAVCAPIDAFGELDEPGQDGGRGGACVALDGP